MAEVIARLEPGARAVYDSPLGLCACTVDHVRGQDVVVDFDEEPTALHWSGMVKNPWSGRTNESVPLRYLVPRQAIKRGKYGPRIGAYRWERA